MWEKLFRQQFASADQLQLGVGSFGAEFCGAAESKDADQSG
jgi:hypothetical protein